MTDSWVDGTLGDLCSFQAGVAFPRSEQGHTSGDYPFIKVSDMALPANSKRIVEANNWVSIETAERMRLKLAPAGAVAFAKIGEGLKAERLRQITRATAMDNNMMAAVPTSGKVDERFLLYLIESVNIASWAQGSALPYLSQTVLSEIPVRTPGLPEQRAIAATLGALDDRIESNRRVVAIAEQLGDALFAAAASESRLLADVADITMGSSPKGEDLNEDGDGLPFYQGTRDFGVRFPSLRIWTTAPVRTAAESATLMSVRAPVGELNRASADCCIGRGVAAIHSDTHPSTLYYAMRSSSSVWDKFQGDGTVFASVNKTDVHGAEIHWVGDGALLELESELRAIDARIESLESETRRLITLREALLPELLSGRIRVSPEGVAA